MNGRRIVKVTTLLVGGGAVGLYLAHSRLNDGIDYPALLGSRTNASAWFTTKAFSAPLRESVSVAADKLIPNIPGKRLISLVVDYPPGVSSASHRHAHSAFIYAYVLAGEIRSQVDNEPPRIFRPGEFWFENPGAHHVVSANASQTNPARLLAVFILDADETQPTIADHP